MYIANKQWCLARADADKCLERASLLLLQHDLCVSA
jgi:hypothetical protein